MNCIKCGRETVSEQVFCPDCLAEMKKYPVRPGTVVQLPQRKTAPAVKKQSKRRAIPAEEQVKTLKKRVRSLTLALILVFAIAVALAVPAVQHITEGRFKIGQNYNTVTATTEPTERN